MSSDEIKRMAKLQFKAHDDLFQAKANAILPRVLAGEIIRCSVTGMRHLNEQYNCDVDWFAHADYAAYRLATIINSLVGLKIDVPATGVQLGTMAALQAELNSIRYVACQSLARVIAPYLVYEELANAKESREQSRIGS